MTTVDVTVHLNKTLIKPWIPAIESQCTAKICKRLYGYEAIKAGRDMSITHIPLFAKASDNSYGVIYTGLLQRVLDYLNKIHVNVQLNDARQGLPEVSIPEDISFRPNQEEVVRALITNHSGRIKAPPAFGKSFIIGVFCKMHTDKRILVVTCRKDVLKELHARIAHAVQGVQVRMCNGTYPFMPNSKVVVCSAQSLHKVPVDWPDIIIFDEVHGAAASSIGRSLMQFDNSRMFGFSATPTGRADGADRINEALFGPIIYDIDYNTSKASGNIVDMLVRIVPVDGPVIHGKDPIDLNRNGIWRNTVRNAKIAKTVQKLNTEGIQKILIMVSTAEHAYYLKQYLPDFHVVHSGISEDKIQKFKRLGILPATEDPNPDIDSIKKLFVSNIITKVIATMKWREGIDVVDLQCVIRADGMSGSIPTIQIGGRTSRIFEGKTRGLVIDYLDDFGEELANRARTRMRHYRAEGWTMEEWSV